MEGEGCVEIFKANITPSIRFDSVKECIRPMNIEKAKAPNMPVPGVGGMGIPSMGGVPVADPMMGAPMDADVMGMAGEDDPF